MNSNIQNWLDHPITQLYMRLLKEHRTAHLDRILNMGTLDNNKLPELGQLKGQINALDLMLNTDQLESFFEGEFNTTDR